MCRFILPKCPAMASGKCAAMFEPVTCRHLKTLLDIGDIVGVTGPIKRTDKGELSIVAQELQVRNCSCRFTSMQYNEKDHEFSTTVAPQSHITRKVLSFVACSHM